MSESSPQPIDLVDAVSSILDDQSQEMEKLIIDCAVPNWLNPEIISVLSDGENLEEADAAEVLENLLDLGLAQPFQDLGYAFHEDVRNVLLNLLQSKPKQMHLHGKLLDFFAEKLESEGEGAINRDLYLREIGYHNRELGIQHLDEGNFTKTQEHLLRALESYRIIQDQQNIIETLARIGQAYLHQEDLAQAEAAYGQAAETAQRLGDIRRACDLLEELGNSLATEHAWDAAVKAYEKRAGLEIPREEDEAKRSRIEDLATLWAKKADWHRLRREWQQAKQAYSEAEYLYNVQGDTVSDKQMRDNIAAVKREQRESSITVPMSDVASSTPDVAGRDTVLSPMTTPEESKDMLQRLRIFISSTTKDLEKERDAVEQAITGLRLEAVRSEKMGSQNISPREACRIMSQECDVYLGILGARYGYILCEDISATEFEFNTAREAGRPILLYRKDVPEEDLERDERQKAFRERLGDFDTGYYIRDFTALHVPDQLKEWVQQDIVALLAGRFRDRMPEPRLRPGPPSGKRTLIASLGRAPGAVTGLYHALKAAGQPVDRVLTISTADFAVKRAVRVVHEEMERESVTYLDEPIAAVDIASDGDAQEFKGAVYRHLATARGDGDEVCIGIAGGRTAMGALLALVAQLEAPEGTLLYQFSVPDDIFEDGQIPRYFNLPPDRQREVLQPPDYHLVPVPFVRFEGND